MRNRRRTTTHGDGSSLSTQVLILLLLHKEHQEIEHAGTIGGVAVVHRLWSFEPASC